MKNLPITEADLHAYADGLLPASRHEEVEAYLAARPEEAERIRAYREQNRGLHALFDAVADEAIPARLHAAAQRPVAAPAVSRWSLQRMAAGFAIAMVSGVLGWNLHAQWQPEAPMVRAPVPNGQFASLPRQAAVAHVVYSPDVRRPVEVGADQEEQLVTWLSKRLNARIRAPKLGTLGYELVGGRLLPGNSGPVAQFMYSDASGQRLTLYVSNENTTNTDTGFRFSQEGAVNVMYWIDGKFGYALSAGVDKGELARIGNLVYEQLQPK
ncbi:MAG TPA: anti-sigma factor [Noviherbaspirillum sp.]